MIIFNGAQDHCCEITHEDFSWVLKLFSEPDHEYWTTGALGGSILFKNPEWEHRLIVIVFGVNNFYFQYVEMLDGAPKKTLLSVANAKELNIVVKSNSDWNASLGLFLGPATATEVVRHFLQTGMPSSGIEWISPSDLPDNGNW
jgi:hypothetical protein